MTEDARFEDASEAPLRLVALEEDDLPVISALCQDAVFPVSEMRWERGRRRFGLLLNRFRWEDLPAAQRGSHQPERVQSVLAFDHVTRVASQGLDRSDQDVILSLLSVTFEEDAEGEGGAMILTLAGDGAIRLDVSEIEVVLRDVTRPYQAVSGKVPNHGV